MEGILAVLSPAHSSDQVVIEKSRGALRKLSTALDRVMAKGSGPGEREDAVIMGKNTLKAAAEAASLFDAGMEHWWAGDQTAACRCYRKALKIDPEHADAHNHLGIASFDKGRFKEAGRHFGAAREAGYRNLEEEDGKVEWGWTENRPYLRAIANLALVFERTGRWEEALALHEELLSLNPGDNQGIRFLVGGNYHRLGRLDEAIAAYESSGLDEPNCCYGLALALHEAGRAEEAGRALLRAFVGNRYVASMLLVEQWERIPASHFISWREPEAAADYVELNADLWRDSPGSVELVRRYWRSDAVKSWLDKGRELMIEVEGESLGDRRSTLLAMLRAVEGEESIHAIAQTVEAEAGGRLVPRRHPHVAGLDEVRITRRDGHAIIEYADESVMTTHLKFDDVDTLTEEEILEAHNELILSEQEARRKYEHVAIEIPPGRPQIEHLAEAGQWVPRGHVLRCLVEDKGNEVRVVVDGRVLTQAEFGKMLTTFSGWGMRIAFVPEDELHEPPHIEVRERGEDH